jgi:gliding motility-associated-like protein
LIDSVRSHVYEINFENAANPQIRGEKPASYYLNYYIGNESSWANRVQPFDAIYYSDLYQKVDLRYYSNAGNLKYDFIIHPSGNASEIAFRVQGADKLTLVDGVLLIKTSLGTIKELAPFAYQIINGKLKSIDCTYRLEGTRVSFELGTYNKDFDLIIDPEVAFSTFIGSTASNFGFTACNDSQDNLIAGAAVFGPGYPTTTGAFASTFLGVFNNYMDMAISKFTADGSQLLYSTYIGGSLQETPHSVVVDSQDNIIVFGVTGSLDYPTTAGAFQTIFTAGPTLSMQDFFTSSHELGCDLFLTKFSSFGALLQSTYVGGNQNEGLNYGDQLFYNYGDPFRGEVNVDDNDRIVVATVSEGGFPMTGPGAEQTFGGGFFDGLVFTMNSTLSQMINSTYLGGADHDACYAIEFAENGNLIIAGGTKSVNFPSTSGVHDETYNDQTDGFITILDQETLEIVASTFVGTNLYDQVFFVQTDPDGNIYTFGQSNGNMPITPGCYGQANSGQFLRKYNSSLSTLIWSTTVGRGLGVIDISPTAFLVSDCNQIFFSGWGGTTNSGTCQFIYDCYATSSSTSGMPISADAIQPNTDGSDFYLCVLSEDAQELVYASFLGGSASAEHVDGGTSRFAKNGTVYQSVCAGCQANSDFPTSPGAWSSSNNSFGCNMAVFRFNLGQIEAEVQLEGPTEICEGAPTNFLNLSQGGDSYTWQMGDGSILTTFNALYTYETPGTYEVSLIVNETTECLIGDTASITITILPGVDPSIEIPETACEGEIVQLNASGSPNLFWLENAALSSTTIPNPTAVASDGLTLFVVDSNNCETDTVSITLNIFQTNTNVNGPFTICEGESVNLIATGGVTYQWSPSGSLSSSSGATVSASPADSTTYMVVITTNNNCIDTLLTDVNVDFAQIGGNIYPPLTICRGTSITLPGPPAASWLWSPVGSLSNPNIRFPVASPDVTTTYEVFITNSCAQGVDEVTVNVQEAQAQAFGDTLICEGRWAPLRAIGGVEYSWSPPSFVVNRFNDTVYVAPSTTMEFFVTVIDENGCADSDSVMVSIIPAPSVDAGPDRTYEAPGAIDLLGNAFGLEYEWSPPEYLTCTDCIYPIASPPDPMYYYLTVTNPIDGCTNIDSVLVTPFYPLYIPNTITPNNDGINDVFFVYGENITGFSLKIFNRWGDLIFESEDPKEPWVPGINGYFVQDGVYQWIVEYETIERRKRLVGHVNVLR